MNKNQIVREVAAHWTPEQLNDLINELEALQDLNAGDEQ